MNFWTSVALVRPKAWRGRLYGAPWKPAFWGGMLLAVVAFPLAAQEAEGDAVSRPALHFVNDVLPILTKFGCNSGACHGKASGQNGFKLSLYGFDPGADYSALVEDSFGRRVALDAPAESLLLTKPTGQTTHGGGVRFDADSAAYRLLEEWLRQGAPWGADDAPQVVRIEVRPDEQLLSSGGQQPLQIIAHYGDGSTRDVTATAEYVAQQPDWLRVSAAGLVENLSRPGEGTVMVRYLGRVGIARVTVPYRAPLPDDSYAGFVPQNFIDELALAKWRRLAIAPSPACTDAEFLRRVSLSVAGVLPSPDEVRRFLADPSPDKRERAVEALLCRPEFADLWAMKWGDWLRNKEGDGDAQRPYSVAFTRWIRDALAHDMPYDRFARAILTVSGKIEDHPEMDWYRQVTSPQFRVEDTSQVFLGLRVQCANCHNHPFESISQKEYWQFAAFFARVDAMTYGTIKTVGLKKDGAMRHPRTGEELRPKPFGGPEVDYVEDLDPRQQLADWMTAPDNPYFARAVVNRVWAHYLGVGLVDAEDDLRETNPASNPALLAALANDFIAHGYDLKHLMRTILTSGLYGLSSLPTEQNAGDLRNYARFYPRRLPSFVLLDALSSATGIPEKFKDFPAAQRAVQLPNEKERSDFLEVFGRTERQTPCQCEVSYEPNLSQVLYLMYSPELQRKMSDKHGALAALLSQAGDPEATIDELYLRTFSRMPTAGERADAAAWLAAAPNDAERQQVAEDLFWTLLNAPEFSFNR